MFPQNCGSRTGLSVERIGIVDLYIYVFDREATLIRDLQIHPVLSVEKWVFELFRGLRGQITFSRIFSFYLTLLRSFTADEFSLVDQRIDFSPDR